MQDSGPITTETSENEGRLMSGAGCQHGKKKCLKCAISKHKDGKGGPGYSAPGYGAKPKKTILPKYPSLSSGGKSRKSLKLSSGVKGMKTLSATVNSLNKQMRFGKALKSAGKAKSLKSMLKGVLK